MTVIFILSGVIGGILAASVHSPLITALACFLLTIALRLTIALITFLKPYLITKINYCHYLWVISLSACIGAFSVFFNFPSYNGKLLTIPDYLGETVYDIEGTVLEKTSTNYGEKYIVLLRHLTIYKSGQGEVEEEKSNIYERKTLRCRNARMILFSGASVQLLPGEKINFRTQLRLSSYKSYPNFEYTAYVSDPTTIKITGKEFHLSVFANNCRDRIIKMIDRANVKDNTGALIKAFLIAEKGGLRNNIIRDFRDAGVMHILAVSGLHTGILAIAMMWLTLPLVLPGLRKTRYLIVAVGIWAFVLLTGMNYSTLRAALMFTATAAAIVYERKNSAFSAACIAGTVILIFSPMALWDIGFQLSFICVSALSLFINKLNPVRQREHPKIYKIAEIILVTLVATASLWSLTSYYFGSHPTFFLLSNLIIVPLLPLYMAIAIIYLLMLALGWDLLILSGILDLFSSLLLNLTSSFGNTSLDIKMPLISVFLWIGGMAAAAIALHIKSPGGYIAEKGEVVVSRPFILVAVVLFIASLGFLLAG